MGAGAATLERIDTYKSPELWLHPPRTVVVEAGVRIEGLAREEVGVGFVALVAEKCSEGFDRVAVGDFSGLVGQRPDGSDAFGVEVLRYEVRRVRGFGS